MKGCLLLKADARRLPIKSESVQCVVTSPPYYVLRKYGVPGEIGLEDHPFDYVKSVLQCSEEIHRVLKPDGCLWMVLGDSYAGAGGSMPENDDDIPERTDLDDTLQYTNRGSHGARSRYRPTPKGFKRKDLMGLPWRIAFGLQRRGWWLRSDTIFFKTNTTPESVKDRPVRCHEYVFLFSKAKWVTRVVQFSNLKCKPVHFFKDFGAGSAESPWAVSPSSGDFDGVRQIAICFAASILDRTQSQSQFGLFSLDSEVWKKGFETGSRSLVRNVPAELRPAIWASRLIFGKATAKEFLRELSRLEVTLDNRNNLSVLGTSYPLLAPPFVQRNADGSITVHYPGQICEINFSQETVSITKPPARTFYFWDHEAIKEPPAADTEARYRRGRSKKHKYLRGGPVRQTIAKTLDHMVPEKKKPDKQRGHGRRHAGFNARWDAMTKEEQMARGRSKRDVWPMATANYKGDHYAVYPDELAQTCILSGSREGDIVLDPFMGSGTTLVVARRLNRLAVGCDLGHHDQAVERITKEAVQPQLRGF